jgi:2-amino-4-hydroxy-6-hydroxymethyldihydropteridine diphosphokinase
LRLAAVMAEALIALGGNVGDVRATLARAVDALCDDKDVRLLARSADYRTPPWGIEDQPAFVNACIAVETALMPRALLARAQAIERAFGRDRAKEQRWGPRTIDIDLIAYDDLTIDEPDLELPHPRLFERAFVLVPLVEIAPEKTIRGLRLRDALTRVDTAGMEKLLPSAPTEQPERR